MNADARVPSEKAASAAAPNASVSGFADKPAIAPPAESTTALTTVSACAAGTPASSRDALSAAPVVVKRTVPRIATPSAEPT